MPASEAAGRTCMDAGGRMDVNVSKRKRADLACCGKRRADWRICMRENNSQRGREHSQWRNILENICNLNKEKRKQALRRGFPSAVTLSKTQTCLGGACSVNRGTGNISLLS